MGALRDQIIGTAILLLLIFAITDLLNTPPGANMAPFIIGLVVVAIGMAWGTDAGYAINPARDLGPRLASYLTGYGSAWRDQYGNLYFWVPIVGPLIGGVLGAAVYRYMITPFLPAAEEQEPGRVAGTGGVRKPGGARHGRPRPPHPGAPPDGALSAAGPRPG